MAEIQQTIYRKKEGVTWCCETKRYKDENGETVTDVNEIASQEMIEVDDPVPSEIDLLKQELADLKAQLNS
jgi:hypothetical protein